MIEWNKIEENIKDKNISKKSKLLFPFIFAFIITLIQFLLFKSISNTSVTSEQTVSILVSKNPMKQGQITTINDFKVMNINTIDLSEQFILNSDLNYFIGKKVLINLNENTPLLKNLFMSPFQKNSLPEKIPYGKRLFVLDLNFGSFASILKVGDKIDLIAYLDIPNFRKATETILQNIQVVAIGDQLDGKTKSNNANSISFYIYPEEVKIITFMKQYAHFSISLRNPNDNVLSKDDAVTLNQFIENDYIQKIIKNDSFKFIQGRKK